MKGKGQTKRQKRERDALVKRLKRRGIIQSSKGITTVELKTLAKEFNKTHKDNKVRLRIRKTKKSTRKRDSQRENLLRKVRKLKKQGHLQNYNVRGQSNEDIQEVINFATAEVPQQGISKYDQMLRIIKSLAEDIRDMVIADWDNEDVREILETLENYLPAHIDKDKVNNSNWVPHQMSIRYLPPSDFEVEGFDSDGMPNFFELNNVILAYFSIYIS